MSFHLGKKLEKVVLSAVTAALLFLTPLSAAADTSQGTPTSRPVTAHSYPHVAFSLRLEDQLLALLNYLPVSFIPSPVNKPLPTTTTTVASATTSSTTPSTTTTLDVTTTTAPPTPTTTTTLKKSVVRPATNRVALVKGVFKWRFGALPTAFRSQWSVGTYNVILRGALMRFQSINSLPTTGDTDLVTWQRLLTAATKHLVNPTTYNVVSVLKSSPEYLHLYANGRIVFSTLVNTGISVMPTASGTYPVYLRYTSQTMSGTNPNGTHYSDPGIPWVSYFNGGDALHGFSRASYGWPQSLGCVEMPFAQANILWPHTPIGTMVTVQ